MTYATQADLSERFGETELAQLTDRHYGASIEASVLDRALADADAEIDGYLASRYALPLASVPTALVRVAADIARYRLYDDRVTDAVRNRYQEAVSYLKAISAGGVVIDGAAPLAAAATTVAVKVRCVDKVFGGGGLDAY